MPCPWAGSRTGRNPGTSRSSSAYRRRALAARYAELLREVPGLRPVRDPAHGQGNFQSYWVLLAQDFPVGRDELLAVLSEAGISARRGIMASHLEAGVRGPRRGPRCR
ncbi:hypothetical protein Scinn_44440 [Streptomyces virginiae]|uniref:Aminotransferase class I/classII domain-containing protein n=1 Tax=Streptomyces virginiae TaxID=1961 RepID=A0ABQ3NQE8_STRVG|nr:DegT/DnrJ/EryC1/StrS family aminotransferase [Streptomyces virginiae]GHI14981.1 hypothetical protein Scinn_44440 [Streptomyces virginiae]